ncbi:MAG: toxin regulator [Acetatifactor sp.]|nr:toxin regulator [Acetatifactor sp.]
MKKHLLCIISISLFLLSGCQSDSVGQDERDRLQAELGTARITIDLRDKTIAELSSNKSELEEQVNELEKQLDALQTEYDTYKDTMSEYEELSEAEAEARKLEAEALIRAEQEAQARAEQEAAAAAEAKEKAGYDTGITYDQLARTPDEYKGELVKFTGKVLQVIEGDSEIDIRLAVDKDYDTVIYCGYDPGIVTSRVLEDDIITVYGVSLGLHSYTSTLGGKITIPAVLVDKIDQ